MGMNLHICINGEWKIVEGYSKDNKWYSKENDELISNEFIHWIEEKKKL